MTKVKFIHYEIQIIGWPINDDVLHEHDENLKRKIEELIKPENNNQKPYLIYVYSVIDNLNHKNYWIDDMIQPQPVFILIITINKGNTYIKKCVIDICFTTCYLSMMANI
jgi:hypothetical protein